MKLTREEVLEKMIKSYEPYFDIKRQENAEAPLVAECNFHVRNEKYVLVKKAQLWSAEGNEHIYIFSVPKLTKEIYEKCRKTAYERGMALIDPKPGHMYTYITAMFLCDESTPEADRALKKCHIHKSFQFSLRGWMDFHTALIDLKNNRTLTNRSGKDNAKFLKKIIQSEREKGVGK